jgi:hypothetical protein
VFFPCPSFDTTAGPLPTLDGQSLRVAPPECNEEEGQACGAVGSAGSAGLPLPASCLHVVVVDACGFSFPD